MLILFGIIFNLFPVAALFERNESKNSKKLKLLSSVTLFKRISLSLILISLLNELSYLSFDWNWNYDLSIVLLDGSLAINTLKIKIIMFVLAVSAILLSFFDFENTPTLKGKFSYSEPVRIYYYCLTSLVGIIYLIISNDLLITLMSWEIINIAIYLLVTCNPKWLASGLKYFLLSALNTSVFMLGLFLIEFELGSLSYENITLSATAALESSYAGIAGSILIVSSILFKLSAVPLHLWAPDLYSKLPFTIAVWLMLLPKIAYLSLLSILYETGIGTFLSFNEIGNTIILTSAILSILFGSIALNSQWLIKRFLAYSSISHIGYMLTALNTSHLNIDNTAYMNYLVIYVITLLTISLILLSWFQSPYSGKIEPTLIMFMKELSGIYKSNNFLAFALSISMFSLAGIPPLLGFFAKLGILMNVSNIYSTPIALVLLFIMIITSVISCLRYLSIIKDSNLDLTQNSYGVINGTPYKLSAGYSYLISIFTLILIFGMLKPFLLSSMILI